MTADDWKGLACDLNNARVDAERRYDEQPDANGGFRLLWRDVVEKVEARLRVSCRDFSTSQFRMFAGYREEE